MSRGRRAASVIVLCDLEGKTRKEAARHFGVPEGTVASRLATGAHHAGPAPQAAWAGNLQCGPGGGSVPDGGIGQHADPARGVYHQGCNVGCSAGNLRTRFPVFRNLDQCRAKGPPQPAW